MLCQAPVSALAQTPVDQAITAASPLQTVSHLPPGRVGKPYGPFVVLSGGTPGYVIDPKSQLPPGLFVTASGFLQGTPSKPGRNAIVLVARDSAQPRNFIQGNYVLDVLKARRLRR